MDIATSLESILNQFLQSRCDDITAIQIQYNINELLNHYKILRSCPMFNGQRVSDIKVHRYYYAPEIRVDIVYSEGGIHRIVLK